MIKCIPQWRSKIATLNQIREFHLQVCYSALSEWCKNQLTIGFTLCFGGQASQKPMNLILAYAVNHSVRHTCTSRFMTQCLHLPQKIWPYTTLKEVSETIQDRSGPSRCDLKNWQQGTNIRKRGYFVCRSFVAGTLFRQSMATARWSLFVVYLQLLR